MAHIPQDAYVCNLLYEAYGAPGCAFCSPLTENSRRPNVRSAFGQAAVAAHGSLSWIRSLAALDVYEGGLVDPGDSAQQARFHTERGDGTKQLDLTVTFKGHWPLAEQLDLMEALRLGLEAGCDHSWRARMRIERRR